MTSSTGPGNGGAQASVTCVECGAAFPPKETIRYQGEYVCMGCKHVYFQRVHEGAASAQAKAPPPKFATFGTRLAAKLVDTVIMSVAQLPLAMMASLALPKGQAVVPGKLPGLDSAPIAGFYLVSFLLGAAYQIYFVGRHGATPGKMALSIHVVTADGSQLTYGRAARRYFAELLSSLSCWIGYIMVSFDKEARALHDHIASTRVVHNA
jgi:uncharacterized RDD family membrane protein YckC